MDNKQIDIPVEVITALEEVRKEGRFNMFSATEVVNRMSELGHHKAFLWMIDMGRFERTSQVKVDFNKYSAACNDLGECLNLADKLTNY